MELRFAGERTREAASCLGLLVLLKTFQCLGYFVKIADVPNSIIRCMAKAAGYEEIPDLTGYDHKTARIDHLDLVRSWVGVSAFDHQARHMMVKACVDISRVREDLADIVNFAMEELIRQKYELPAFSALLRAARTARATVNRGYYTRIANALDTDAKQRIAKLFQRLPEARQTGWDVIKSEPRQPTVKEIRRFVEHMSWLRDEAGEGDPLAGIPPVKVNRFVAEGRSLNAARMGELTENKRYAVAAAVLFHQRATAFDDGAQMLVRQMGKIGHSADEALQTARAESAEGATELVKTLRDVTLAYRAEGTSAERLLAIGSSLGPDSEALLQRCEAHVAWNSGNFVQRMPEFFRNPRTALVLLLENLQLESTSQDTRLLRAVALVVENQSSRSASLPALREETAPDGSSRQVPMLDLSFVPEEWWELVTGQKKRSAVVRQIDRRYLEMCVLHQVSEELQAGDLCVPLGQKFRDYRRQLIALEDYEREVITYGEPMNIPVDGKALVARLQSELREQARETDHGIPANPHIRIENGQPILTPVRADPAPIGFANSNSS